VGLAQVIQQDGGFVAANQSVAAGRADPRLHVLGSLRVGSLWESLAIPELRQQAQQIALALTAPA